MIKASIKGADLVGRKCHPTRRIRTKGGLGVTENAVCTILSVIRGHEITIRTDPCPHCGQYVYITGLSRDDLQLIDDHVEE